MLCSDCLSDSTMDCDWLHVSHVKNADAKVIGRIAFFTCENITYKILIYHMYVEYNDSSEFCVKIRPKLHCL